jgi:rhomboid family GlyGly-CTERM serine protease
MGLIQGDTDHRQFERFSDWLLPGLIVVIATAIALSGDTGREFLRYDRDAIVDGQAWRLLSGHFAHLGAAHFGLNVVGLALIAYLVIARFSPGQWLLIILLVILGIDLGFWLLEPQLRWYVGLSGLLHGIWAAGAIGGLRTGQIDYRLLLGILVGKLVYEQLVGPLPGSEDSTGGNVIVAAHLYGAISGAFIAAGLSFRKPPTAPI